MGGRSRRLCSRRRHLRRQLRSDRRRQGRGAGRSPHPRLPTAAGAAAAGIVGAGGEAGGVAFPQTISAACDARRPCTVSECPVLPTLRDPTFDLGWGLPLAPLVDGLAARRKIDLAELVDEPMESVAAKGVLLKDVVCPLGPSGHAVRIPLRQSRCGYNR